MSAPKRSQIEAIGARSPEFAPFLALVEVTLAEAREPVWSTLVADGSLVVAADLAPAAPRLAGSQIAVPASAARGLTARLLEAASWGSAARSSKLDPLALLEAAIDHDDARLARLAADLAMDPASLGPIAQLAAAPLLQACRGALARRIEPDAGNSEGYCPICGAWPTMAEVRGLERRRRLRCGRCGGDWGIDALSCPFCAQRDHERLVALVPESGGEARKVEACQGCHGYVKTLASLTAWPGESVLLHDLDTVDLDIAARDRGYDRPRDPGRRVGVRITAAPEKKRSRWGIFS